MKEDNVLEIEEENSSNSKMKKKWKFRHKTALFIGASVLTGIVIARSGFMTSDKIIDESIEDLLNTDDEYKIVSMINENLEDDILKSAITVENDIYNLELLKEMDLVNSCKSMDTESIQSGIDISLEEVKDNLDIVNSSSEETIEDILLKERALYALLGEYTYLKNNYNIDDLKVLYLFGLDTLKKSVVISLKFNQIDVNTIGVYTTTEENKVIVYCHDIITGKIFNFKINNGSTLSNLVKNLNNVIRIENEEQLKEDEIYNASKDLLNSIKLAMLTNSFTNEGLTISSQSTKDVYDTYQRKLEIHK